MGHGYNHYTNCNCAWCVNNRGGKIMLTTQQIYLNQRLKLFDNYFSLTIPNAKCKFCGDPIFFYQNPYGSKVFFDSLGKPWPKHKCYYEETYYGYDYEVDITLNNVPELITDKIDFPINLNHIAVTPKILEYHLKGHLSISIFNTITNLEEEYIIKYDKKEFGICFFLKEGDNLKLDGFINDEAYCLECFSIEEAKKSLKHIFPYSIGEEIEIEIYKENKEKDRIQIYYYPPVKGFRTKPLAYIYYSDLKPNTLNLLDSTNGMKISVKSTLNKRKEIIFTKI
jgi:hypothetical protein